MNAKSKALRSMKQSPTAGRRSSATAVTEEDKELSVKHLKDSVKFNEDHAKDHAKLEAKEKGEESKAKSAAVKKKLRKAEAFNKDHEKHHLANMKEDERLLAKEEAKEKKK